MDPRLLFFVQGSILEIGYNTLVKAAVEADPSLKGEFKKLKKKKKAQVCSLYCKLKQTGAQLSGLFW